MIVFCFFSFALLRILLCESILFVLSFFRSFLFIPSLSPFLILSPFFILTYPFSLSHPYLSFLPFSFTSPVSHFLSDSQFSILFSCIRLIHFFFISSSFLLLHFFFFISSSSFLLHFFFISSLLHLYPLHHQTVRLCIIPSYFGHHCGVRGSSASSSELPRSKSGKSSSISGLDTEKSFPSSMIIWFWYIPLNASGTSDPSSCTPTRWKSMA